MSFRDTFTRGSGSSENLQYDDTAAYHFYLTILILITFPLLYSIIKSILNPFGDIPYLSEIQNRIIFKQKVNQFKKQKRFNYVTKWFVFKVILSLALCFLIVKCTMVVTQEGSQMKGFDPYEILQVDPFDPIEKIKKSYRKLALKYHPDRNQDDPQASAKFIMISKAYECLTNDDAKQNCLKYGNPQGSTSFNVGIALPSFLVKKQNQVLIMAMVLILVVIVLPIVLMYYFSELNKYDETGMLMDNHPYIHLILNEQFSHQCVLKLLPTCLEFRNLGSSSKSEEGYKFLFSKASQDIRKLIQKDKSNQRYKYKGLLLLDACIQEKSIPEVLQNDYKMMLKTCPTLIRAMVHFGVARSTAEYKYYYRNQKFVGLNALISLIQYGQHLIQAKSFSSQPYEQINFTEDELNKIFKKKRQKQTHLLKLIQKNTEQRQKLLQFLTDQRKIIMQEEIKYLPTIQIKADVHTGGHKDITTQDIIQTTIRITSNRKGGYSSAHNYPFLKLQGWYLLVSFNNIILHFQYFTFDTPEYQSKFSRRPLPKGQHTFDIRVLSDCYYGLDALQTPKFQVVSAHKKEEQVTNEEEKEEVDEGLFSRIMSSVIPKEEEELSDKQE